MLNRQNAKQPAPSRPNNERRTRLLDATVNVILEKGIGNLTLDAVCEGAHVSKGGLLYYFDGKAALLEALADELTAQLESEPDRQTGAPGVAEARMYLRAVACMSELPRSQRLRKALASICVAHPELAQRIHSKARRQPSPPSAEMSIEELHLRLLADGLWLADVYPSYRIGPQRRQELLALVEADGQAGGR